ncbi:MAG TPA: TIGR03618 family F420-dependent PPOX class oxidoreductase [Sporichthyaceae bacterium]|jgi:PPOX class probable F420-dependent enzyme
MVAIPAPLRELIESGPLAHLVTLDPDGSPQVTIIWIGLDGDDIVSGHMNLSKKLRNVAQDPRVVYSLEAPRTPGVFLAEHAVLRGHAVVEEGGAHALLTKLGKIYVAPEFAFPSADQIPGVPADSQGFILRTTVDRVTGMGPWA